MKSFLAKHLSLKLPAVFLFLISASYVFGATGDVDPSFNPKLTIDISRIGGGSIAIQPDGKVIVFGAYNIPGRNSLGPYINRLNPDSSTDTTFDCPECRSFIPTAVAFQQDGKILVGGGGRLIRINQNGDMDTSFTVPFGSTTPPCGTNNIVVQPDGKSLVKCSYQESSGSPVKDFVIRLNTNGSEDTSFARINLQPGTAITEMVLLPNGRLLLGGGYYTTSGGWLSRYESNGSLDNSFQATSTIIIRGIGLLPDGNYLVAGGFASSRRIARLFTDGSLDTSFTASVGPNETVAKLRILSNGQFYVHLYVNSFPVTNNRIVRYNANGSVDNSFSQSFSSPGNWVVDASDRIIVNSAGFYRLNLDGTIDSSFTPSVFAEGYPKTGDIQSDGKIVITGEFTRSNGFNSGRITRLTPNGTADTSFNPGSGFDVPPTAVKIQPDGKILAGGRFSSYNGIARSGLVRINVDGSLDTTFNTTFTGGANTAWQVEKILVQPNGKVLVGGGFSAVNGTTRQALARLNADGSLDSSFNPPTLSSTAEVLSLYLQSDGSIMVGGNIGTIRLTPDGNLDTSFNSSGTGGPISDILQRADGKYIVSFKPVSTYFATVQLFNNNGTRDFSFQPPTMQESGSTMVNTIFEQANGNIIYGGAFTRSNLRLVQNIGRINSNGGLDIFFPQFSTNGPVNKILGQSDGKVIFIGDFSGIENVGRSGIARLTLNTPVITAIRGTLFDFDGDGRSDITVFRPSTSTWYSLSSNSPVRVQNFGADGDIAAPADYDGDGKTDLGLFRPSTGLWLYFSSQSNAVYTYNWGTAGDIPLPSDVTGDGKADLVVYRPSNSNWYRTPGGSLGAFGIAGDKPLIGDFDGDSRADLAVYRPSTGVWWYAASSAGFEYRAVQWGLAEDVPVPGDYDGDGKTDFAVFRPSNGGWYIANSGGGYTLLTFGLNGDKPVAADYDGDGKTDIAVFRPSTGAWYLLQSTAGFSGAQWGNSTDIPAENAFINQF